MDYLAGNVQLVIAIFDQKFTYYTSKKDLFTTFIMNRSNFIFLSIKIAV